GRNPPPGLIAAALASYVYTDARRFVRSVSSEQGQRFAITARVAHPALGSDFNFRQVSASYARFFALPWRASGTPLHHVFAARVAGGVARGDQNERHLFSLGGSGSGAELRAEVVLGYILPTDVRLGCAHGLERSPSSILDCYAALGGVF